MEGLYHVAMQFTEIYQTVMFPKIALNNARKFPALFIQKHLYNLPLHSANKYS